MKTENFDLERMDRELQEMEERMKTREAQGLSDVYKYFDRINDKLSSFNNMLIAGYFAIIALSPNASELILIVPITNTAVLIYLDYRMMEQGRFLSKVMSQPTTKIDGYGNRQNQITLISLLTIISTSVVTVFFLVLLHNTELKM